MYFYASFYDRFFRDLIDEASVSVVSTDGLTKMMEDIRKNAEIMDEKNEQRFENMNNEMRKKDAKIDDLTNLLHQKDSQLKEYGIRLGILEQKNKSDEFIDLENVKSMLKYFNLEENCTEADIEDAINMRVLEFSPESFVNSSVTQGMSEEEREKMTSQLNRAQEKRLDWKMKK